MKRARWSHVSSFLRGQIICQQLQRYYEQFTTKPCFSTKTHNVRHIKGYVRHSLPWIIITIINKFSTLHSKKNILEMFTFKCIIFISGENEIGVNRVRCCLFKKTITSYTTTSQAYTGVGAHTYIRITNNISLSFHSLVGVGEPR